MNNEANFTSSFSELVSQYSEHIETKQKLNRSKKLINKSTHQEKSNGTN